MVIKNSGELSLRRQNHGHGEVNGMVIKNSEELSLKC